MKKEFELPELTIQLFSATDIITTSPLTDNDVNGDQIP